MIPMQTETLTKFGEEEIVYRSSNFSPRRA